MLNYTNHVARRVGAGPQQPPRLHHLAPGAARTAEWHSATPRRTAAGIGLGCAAGTGSAREDRDHSQQTSCGWAPAADCLSSVHAPVTGLAMSRLSAGGGLSVVSDYVRGRVSASVGALFARGDYPLAGTLDYAGDPGLFGPDSMTWPVVGDAAVFVAGVRALLVQAAHPEVAAGVAEHSRYRQDPLGRLSRTAAYVTATSFGAMPEAERAVALVRRRHRPVTGMSARGEPYRASDPALSAWVHNALTDSLLAAYRHYGARPCDAGDADRFVAEQRRVGALLDAEPLPETARSLARWIEEHPALASSGAGDEAIRFLRDPPLPPGVRPAYGLLFRAAVATVPDRILQISGLGRSPGDAQIGRAAVVALRWCLGSSPDWRRAQTRAGSPAPAGVTFRGPEPKVLGTAMPGSQE